MFNKREYMSFNLNKTCARLTSTQSLPGTPNAATSSNDAQTVTVCGALNVSTHRAAAQEAIQVSSSPRLLGNFFDEKADKQFSLHGLTPNATVTKKKGFRWHQLPQKNQGALGSKETPPPGGVFYLLCSLIKNCV